MRMLPKFLPFGKRPGINQTLAVPLCHRDLWIAFGLAGVVILLGTWQMVVGVCGVYHDDAIYVITAKALAQGKGYRLINLPNAPFQTKYPFLYPALLAIIWKIWPSFPENLLAMQGLSLLAGAGTVAFAYLFLVHFGYTSRGVALVSGLFCATSAFYLFFCTLTLSEAPYALLSILALWGIARQMQFPFDNPGSQIVLGLLLALPFLTRVIGFVLVPAGLVSLYLAGRRIRWVGLGAALLVLPWILWMLVGPQWSPNQVETYYTNYGSWWSSFGLLNLSRMFIVNLFYTIESIAIISITLIAKMAEQCLAINILSIFIGLILISQILKDLLSGKLLALYLVGYFGIVVFWPWPPFRFLVPILPFLLAYLLKAIWETIKKFRVLYNRRLLLALSLIILLGFNLKLVYQIGKVGKTMGYPDLSNLQEPVSWSSYEHIFHWINNHTLPNDVIVSGLDSMIYLYTGRSAFRPFAMNPMALFYFRDTPPSTLGNLIYILRSYQPKYLIQTPMPMFSEEKPFSQIIYETFKRYPGLLETVYVGKDKRFLIYKIQLDRLPAANY